MQYWPEETAASSLPARLFEYRVAGVRPIVRQREVRTRHMKVTIADDDVLLREGLSSLLVAHGFEVVGQASTAEDIVALTRSTQPDLVILDIRMPPTQTVEGLTAAKQIRAEFREIGIVLLSAHVEVELATELLGSGRGIGYLLKSRIAEVDDFYDTLATVARGGVVVDPALVSELFNSQRRADELAALTQRERDVLAQMAEGRSNSGIARELWISEATVEKHVQRILLKLGLTGSNDDHRRVLAVLRFLDAS